MSGLDKIVMVKPLEWIEHGDLDFVCAAYSRAKRFLARSSTPPVNAMGNKTGGERT